LVERGRRDESRGGTQEGPFWSLLMDLLPSRVIGASSGFLNTGGQIAGIAAPVIIGALIQLTGHYEAGFTFMAISAGVSALLVGVLKEAKVRAVAGSVVVSG
jgi:sugar phosphate permease